MCVSSCQTETVGPTEGQVSRPPVSKYQTKNWPKKKMQLKLKTEENIVYVYAWSSNGGLSQNCPNTLPHPPLADRWDWLQLPRDPTKVFKVENGLMVKSLVVKELMKPFLTSVALTCNIPHSQSDHMVGGGGLKWPLFK